MAGIFISYRREDSIAYAGRLYDRLQAHFGDEQVFMDIDTLQPGEGFVVAGCIAIADHVPKHSRALLTRYFSYSHRDKPGF
jgi:hypothetical protein